MSSVVTFYSYKGGVGRSMAVANISYELSKKGKKVLVIDWDLEAPGIEKYFTNFKIESSESGLLYFLTDLNDGKNVHYGDYLTKIDSNFEHEIFLFPSGYDGNSKKYTESLEKFNWKDFFEKNNGGAYLENLRLQWLNDFDFILIDSRTGLNDLSGICTILLPDIIIPMFSANSQSLFGTRDVMEYVEISRQKLSVDRMALTILPIICRFGTRVEYKESQKWLDLSSEVLEKFYTWLPPWIEPRFMLEQVKLPHVEYFSFGEKLAVVEQGTSDPESLGYVYSKIASLLANEFKDIVSFVGKKNYEDRKQAYIRNKVTVKRGGGADNPFEYDVFVSYPRFAYQWIKESFLPVLTEYLTYELQRIPKVFIDYSDNKVSESLENINNSLHRSKTLLLVYSSAEAESHYLNYELDLFKVIEKLNDINLIFPLLITGTEFTNNKSYILEKHQTLDFSNFSLEKNKVTSREMVKFIKSIEELAKSMAKSIKKLTEQPARDIYSPTLIHDDQISNYIKVLATDFKDSNTGNLSEFKTRSIINQCKWISRRVRNRLELLSNSRNPGERLIAIVALQESPNYEYLPWLTSQLRNTKEQFLSYQAAVALHNAVFTLKKDHGNELRKIITAELNNLGQDEFSLISIFKMAIKRLDTQES